MYFLYILECGGEGRRTLYTGITTDLTRRLLEHKTGKGGNYTRSRSVRKMLYTEEHPDRSSASKREAEVKKMTRAAKLKLIHEKV